jgi:hypothetical protein
MKHSLALLKLIVALTLLLGLFNSCAPSNGLSKKHCMGLKAHPHYKKHR